MRKRNLLIKKKVIGYKAQIMSDTRPTTVLGAKGERAVSSWLEKQGFCILTHNYRVRSGEVDIIAQQGNVIAFIEVKTRKNNYFPMSLIVTPTKQQRVIRAARTFIASKNLLNHTFRFDVALVTWLYDQPSIEYIPNAFTQKSW